MKRATLAILTALLGMIAGANFISCVECQQERNSTGNQATYSLDHIRATIMTDPAKALKMLDTAESKKFIPQYDIYGLKSIIYNNIYKQSNIALIYMRRAYECPECATDLTLKIKTLKTLGMLNYKLGYDSDALKYLKEGMEASEKMGDKNGEAYFTMNLAFVKSELGAKDEALKNINESITLFKQTELAETDFYVADNILMACLKKLDLLVSKQDFKEAEEAIPECEKAYEQLLTYDNTPSSHLDARLAESAAMKGIIYHGLNDKKRAEKYFNEVIHTAYAKTPAGTTTAIPCFMYMEKFKAALEYLKKQENFYINTKDTVSEGFVSDVLQNQMVAYNKLRMYKEASAVGLRLVALADSLKKQERNDKLMEMMTAYETETKEAKLRENALKISQMRLFIYAVIIVCILLMVVIGIVLYYNKRMRLRNLATVKTIEELMEQKDKLLDIHINDTGEQEGRKDKVKNLKKDLSDLNMRNAVKMLKADATYQIAEIAHDCGFSSEKEFCHVFETRYGISPVDYRMWSSKLRVKEQIEENNEEFKRNLLRNISHEIRTPLNQISGFVQLLTYPELDISQSEKERFKDIIMNQASHMTHMINDFVEITEYESSMKPLEKEVITMQELLNRISCSAGDPQQGVKLNICTLATPFRIVHLNVKGMVRIAEALLSNAIKFTTEGEISVDLLTDDKKNILILMVSDTGKAISPEHAERIFERFYKEDNFVPGIGLGLSLVRIIATRMSGTAYLDTTYSAPGSRFVVEIPLLPLSQV